MAALHIAAEAVINALSHHCDGGARRLFHGRGHCYAELDYINIDWYQPVLLITLYKAVEEAAWDEFVLSLAPIKALTVCAVVQHRQLRGGPIDVLWGQLPSDLCAVEHGLRYSLSLGEKQNIGFFLDMEPGRHWLQQRAKDRRVLNLFAYTCAFSVAAIAGGADRVVNVDMSKAALAVGRHNHLINQQQHKLRRDVQFLGYDLFRSWGKVAKQGPYDIAVIDPPSRQKGSFIATKDYVRVLRRIASLMTPGADLLLCLNAPELSASFLSDCVVAELPGATLVARLDNREDLPEIDAQRNVKMLHYRLA